MCIQCICRFFCICRCDVCLNVLVASAPHYIMTTCQTVLSLQEIFTFLAQQLKGLNDPDSVAFKRYFYLLEVCRHFISRHWQCVYACYESCDIVTYCKNIIVHIYYWCYDHRNRIRFFNWTSNRIEIVLFVHPVKRFVHWSIGSLIDAVALQRFNWQTTHCSAGGRG